MLFYVLLNFIVHLSLIVVHLSLIVVHLSLIHIRVQETEARDSKLSHCYTYNFTGSATFIHLHIVNVCFHGATTELGSDYRHLRPTKLKHFLSGAQKG